MTGTGQDRPIADRADPSAGRPPARRAARWAGYGIAALACTLALAYLLLVPAADWLARHDIGNLTGKALETARNNARGSMLTLTAGLAGLGALVFTARNFTLQRRSLELSRQTFEENAALARRTLEVTEQGQVTDRYIRAIEQFGSEQVSVRVGAIYALERIARDSERDSSTVMEVLTAFLRQHAEKTREAEGPPPMLGDIRAAAVVIGRREYSSSLDIRLPRTRLEGIRLPHAQFADADLRGVILHSADLGDADLHSAKLAGADLGDADLRGADLGDADLGDADLGDADLRDAKLDGANLGGAVLRRTDLRSVNLHDVNLRGADLRGAILRGTDLRGVSLRDVSLRGAVLRDAVLRSAVLRGAILRGVILRGADLRGAKLGGADLGGADLREADLRGADLRGADLGSADLDGAQRGDRDHPLAGWTRNSEGKLQREAG